ncbi:chromosome segregation protein SMC [Alphaproteobacteria bacterium]|nr:chromosome segregation protein SMC [Alphaproteobacteria bacterium]
MKFKSVRISGFKSFLEPTEILINDGLTGVVGPNGCGKSNIVEAIKWVMGENSARQMRGDEMDDIIFAGTSERPARNFAEVSIKLDNSERKAPANFNHLEEIEISRKIEREKGSIYRVNSKQVRARDIQLIFADNGTGARSSGIVSQGRIAQIIDATSEDRRIILEEAANIKGLHNRRHEAELKLNGANENLNRLMDIEQTYQDQLIELEKQGRKAARYRSVGDRLRKAEATLFLTLLNTAENEFNDFKKHLDIAKENVNKGQINVSKHTEAKQEILDELPEFKKLETKKITVLQSLNITKIRLEEEKSSAKTTLNNTLNQISQIETDIQREVEIKQDAKKTLLSLFAEEEKLKSESTNFLTKKTDALKLVKDLKAKTEEANTKLSTITSEIYSIKSDKSDLEKRISVLTDKIKNSEFQISEFNSKEDEQLLKKNNQQLSKLKQILRNKNQNLVSNKQELIKLEEKEVKLSDQKSNTDQNFNVINAELNSLSSILGDDTLNKNSLEKSINNIGNLEKAIGSVLGETLLAPIHSNQNHFLKNTYWRNDLKTKFSSELPKGAIPIISEIKKNSILDIALIGVGIVKDEETAYDLQKNLSFGQALTTSKGGLWRWDGFVQPQGVQNSYSERLQQIAKLRLLQNKLPAVTKEQKIIESKIDENQLGISKCKRDIIELESQISELIKNSNTLELTNSKLDAKLLSSKVLLKEHQDITKISQKELVGLKNQLNNSINLPSLLADELKIRNIADQCRNELADAMASEQQIKTHESFQARNLMQINNQSENWKKRENEASMRLISLQDRLKKLKDDQKRLTSLPDDFEKREEDLNKQIDKAVQDKNIASDKLVHTETNLHNIEKLEREAEQKVTSFREEMIKIDASLNLARTKIQNIEARVFEKLRINTDKLFEIVGFNEKNNLNVSIELLERTVQRLINERESLGAVNLRAEEEMKEMKEKIETMSSERIDLELAIEKLRTGIFELNKEGRQRLKDSFNDVNKNFKDLFQKLFGGGDAELKLVGSEDPLKAGLEVLASPPGKKMQLLSLLSGGEQALTAISLIFSVFLCNPAPICILDEVDAPLDDTNVGRFCDLLNKIVAETNTYFMVVTHHRLTMAKMDRLFGVTMEQKGVSRLVSVNLEEANRIRDIA